MMNRIYRTVWNHRLGITQVASEQSRRAGKTGGRIVGAIAGLLLAMHAPSLLASLPEQGSAQSLSDQPALVLDAGLDWSLAGAWARSTARSVDVGDEARLVLAGVVSGSGALSKTGNGTLVLTGNNSFSGAVTVAGGTLAAASNTALGTSAGTTTVNGVGSQLEIESGVTLNNQSIRLQNGATVINHGSLINTSTTSNSYGVGGTSVDSASLRAGNVENHGYVRGTRAGIALSGTNDVREVRVENLGANAQIVGQATTGGGSAGAGIVLSGGSSALQIGARVDNLDGARISGDSSGHGIQATQYVTTHVVNRASSIQGGSSAVSLAGRNSSLTNSAGGSVTSTGSYAVDLTNGGVVSNAGTGSLIRAQTAGGGGTAINIAGYAGEVNNSDGAVISGGSVSGTGVNLLNGQVRNLDGATIRSGGTAVRTTSTSGQSTLLNRNSSILSSTAAAVSIAGNGLVENLYGVLEGWTRGLVLGAGGSVLNQGSGSRISALRNDRLEPPNAAFGDPIRVTGISIQGGQGQVQNLDGAAIYGYTRGIWLESGGSVLNAGAGSLIEGERNFGVVISGGTAQLENRDGAVIRGGVPSSSSNGSSAVVAFGAGGDLLNSGQGSAIHGNADVGVLIQCSSGCYSSSVQNLDGAQISGGVYGLYLSTNVPEYRLPNGQFSSQNPDGADYSLQLINSGLGSLISSNYGVYTASSLATLYNLEGARIQGTVQGVNLAGGGTLINDRTSSIAGGSDGAVLSSGAAVVLHNEGSIVGKIELSGSYANSVHLYEGSTLLGDLNLGNHAGSRLILSGEGDQLYSAAVNGITAFDGSLIKQGGGLWNLDSNIAHHGATLVEGGTLAVNGSIANSAVTVRSGATLGGSGSVGATHVEAGGRLAPGNSIGVLNVNGDLVLNPAATFDVEVDADGNADQVIVTGGTAYLNGSNLQLSLLSPNANYRAGVQNTILTADAIDGTFGAILGNPFAFLDFSLNYGGTSVVQAITRNALGFADVAQTRNQKAAASALDSLDNSALYNRISALTASQAPGVFDSLSGELHASLSSALLEDSQVVREASLQRMAGVLADRQQFENGLTLWSHASSQHGRIDSDNNAASLARELNSLVLGVDGQAGDWTLGALAGLSDGSVDVKQRNSSAQSSGYYLGGYASRGFAALSLRLGASYAWHDIDSRRDTWDGAEEQRLKAGYDAHTAQAFAELGYAIAHADTRLEPFVGLTQVQVKTDGFREKGGDARLQAGASSTDQTLLRVGLRAQQDIELAGLPVELSGSLALQHALGQVDSDRTLAFESGNAFKVAGVDVPRDVLQASLAGAVELAPGLRAALGYSGQLGSDGQSNSLQASLSLSF